MANVAARRKPASPVQFDGGAQAVLPVARPNLASAAAILPYLNRIDEARWYSNFGPLITELEARLASGLGDDAKVCTVANATQALILALKAMGAPQGSLCAMPSWTFVATAHAAIQAGLTPWFLDVDPEDWMLRPDAVEAALADAPGPVGAVIPVAAFGAPPDIDGWAAFSERNGIPVLIDAAAAFDTARDARVPLCVSLHATKALGVGEGGFFACQDAALMERFRGLSSFGFLGSRESVFPASNAKLSEYAGAVGLAALDAWPSTRLRWLRAAQHMRIALIDLPQARLQPGWGVTWISSTCVVELPENAAEAAERALAADGVQTRRWWGMGCHESPAFVGAPQTGLPVTERLARSCLGLPFAVDLTDQDVRRVATALRAALGA